MFKMASIILNVLIMVIGLSISAHATLVDMGDGTIYDTATQLSWIKDVSAGGYITWAEAKTWAASLNNGSGFAGLTGWRLPVTTQPDATCSAQNIPPSGFPLQGYGYSCSNSEMGHLYYVSLGNIPNPSGFPSPNAGPFNWLAGFWSDNEYAPSAGQPGATVWYFHFKFGYQGMDSPAKPGWVMAVRPGARTVGGGGGGATPVGYSLEWLLITLASLTLAGGYLLRKKDRI